MPIFTTVNVQAGDPYPSTIGIEFNLTHYCIENRVEHRSVSGLSKVRGDTATNKSPYMYELSHVVTLANKRWFEEHYAVNRNTTFAFVNTNAGISAPSVRYERPPQSTMLGGGFWRVKNALVQT
jgi:hypothetical protein